VPDDANPTSHHTLSLMPVTEGRRASSSQSHLSTARNLLVSYVPLFVRRTQNGPDRNCDHRSDYKISHALFANWLRRESLHLHQLSLEIFPEKQIDGTDITTPLLPSPQRFALESADRG
jgi:hypothetical protein